MLNCTILGKALQSWEGLTIRPWSTEYVFGRASKTKPSLLRIKPREMFRATVMETVELERNLNPLEYNELGYAKRSSHKANKVSAATLGALVCKENSTEAIFAIGTGFTETQRKALWAVREKLIGQEVFFWAQRSGRVKAPRSPVFAAFVLDKFNSLG